MAKDPQPIETIHAIGSERVAPPIRESRWIDYVLIGLMSSLALYSAGQAIGQPQAGWILIAILAFGIGTSYLLGRLLKGTAFVVLDAWVYLSAAFVAFFFQSALNMVLPEDAIPPEIRTCGLLCWMLSLGSFGTWRDGPLLFQAVPGLALFGLVGVYDTFPEAPFYFFGYLLCLAVLFGRAQARMMLMEAYRSGFSRIEEGVSLSEENSEQDAMLNAMRRGPWRWMAGPEWALASAAAVILISLVGAPIIKSSVKDFSGFVQLNLPKQMKTLTHQNEASTQNLVKVGNGPRSLSSTIVMLARLDKPRYLRATSYTVFDNNNWVPDASPPNVLLDEVRKSFLDTIVKPVPFIFDIVTIVPEAHQLALPAEVLKVSSPNGRISAADGTFTLNGMAMHNAEFPGEAEDPGITPGDPHYPDCLSSTLAQDTGDATQKVRGLVEEVVKGQRTDWDKANAIMAEIGHRCKYNLKAPAVPADANAVESFLFDQKEGYCDLFASAMVVMARAAGITARYATGYLPNEEMSKDRPGFYVVRESDAHAWAELYFKGVGWVVFDATGGAQDVTPGGINRTGSLDWRPIIQGGVAAIILGALGYFGWRMREKVRPTPRGVITRKRLGRAYATFADYLGGLAKQRRTPSFTPDAWLHHVSGSLGSLTGPAQALNARFVAALYSPAQLSDEDLASLESDVKAFKRLKRTIS